MAETWQHEHLWVEDPRRNGWMCVASPQCSATRPLDSPPDSLLSRPGEILDDLQETWMRRVGSHLRAAVNSHDPMKITAECQLAMAAVNVIRAANAYKELLHE